MKNISQLTRQQTASGSDLMLIETPTETCTITKDNLLKEINDKLDTLINKVDGINNYTIEKGQEWIEMTGNQMVKFSVLFKKQFTTAPIVVATLNTAVPFTEVQGLGVRNITQTGFDIYLIRNNSTTTIVNWIAVSD